MAIDYKSEEYKNFNAALGECLSRLRDLSVRDGVQSWDANRWANDEICEVLREFDKLAVLTNQYTGKRLAPLETWGGGQVLQPARSLGEDPFENLMRMRKAAPNVAMQSLYRGRQAYGMLPVSDEIQNLAVRETGALGTGTEEGSNFTIRIFDMMNDIENMKAGIKAGLAYRAEQAAAGIPEDRQLVIEGAISYMSPPEEGEAAWTVREYANLALKLAKEGCHEIAIKDYAGLIVTEKQVKDLVSAIRAALDEEGFKNTHINLHSHGQKVNVLMAAMEAGVHKVDVASGELSRGPSHTNLKDMLSAMMRMRGFNMDKHAEHPVLQQIDTVEKRINSISQVHKSYRAPAVLPEEEILKTRLAGGAVAALWRIIAERYNTDLAPLWKDVDWKNNKSLGGVWQEDHAPSAEEFFKLVLKNLGDDWRAGGQFNTVTPGATILYDMTAARMKYAVMGKHPPLGVIPQSYKDVLMGRWGQNIGMEKELGDTSLRDAFRMEAAIKIIRASHVHHKEEFFKAAGLDALDQGNGWHKNTNVLAPEEETHLLEILKSADFEKFSKAIEAQRWQESFKQQLRDAVGLGRFPTPTLGIAEGRAEVAELELGNPPLLLSDIPWEPGRLSARDRAALLMMLTRTADKGYGVGQAVLRNNHSVAAGEGFEPPRDRHLQAMLGEFIEPLGDLIAQKQVLQKILRLMENNKNNLVMRQTRQERLNELNTQLSKAMPALREKLEELVNVGALAAEETPQSLAVKSAQAWLDRKVAGYVMERKSTLALDNGARLIRTGSGRLR